MEPSGTASAAEASLSVMSFFSVRTSTMRVALARVMMSITNIIDSMISAERICEI